MDLCAPVVHGGASSRDGADCPGPRGAQVRDVTRRLRPVLAAGLALMATAAGWPAASARPVHAVLTSSYARAGLAASDAVLQLPGYARSGSSAVVVADLSPGSRAAAVARLRRPLQAVVRGGGRRSPPPAAGS